MEDNNEVLIEGKVVTAPTIGKMPVGTPILWFTLESQESFDDSSSGLTRARSSQFRVEILGKNVSLYADKIVLGKKIRVKGFLRTDNNQVKIRVYRLTILRTYHEGLMHGYDMAITLFKNNQDADKTIQQLEIMREACDPKNPNSAAT